MTTSAQRLNELLSPISRSSEDTLFLDAAAKKLGVEGDDYKFRTMNAVYLTVKNLRRDIDRNSDDEVFLKRANQLFTPFSTLLNFSGYHHAIKTAKQNYLKAEHLTGLTDLHLMLKGISFEEELPHEEAKELSSEFEKLRVMVRDSSGIPDSLKSTLITRLNQISVAFDKYFAFGEEGMERELESLVGAIILHSHEASPEGVTVLKKVWDAAGRGFGFVKSANDKAGTLISFSEKIQKIQAFWDAF